MNNYLRVVLYTEGFVALISIIYLIFKIIREAKRHRIIMAELHRQQARVHAAYGLHTYVMKTYGFEYLKLMPSPDEIIEDDKPITVFNYLDI